VRFEPQPESHEFDTLTPKRHCRLGGFVLMFRVT